MAKVIDQAGEVTVYDTNNNYCNVLDALCNRIVDLSKSADRSDLEMIPALVESAIKFAAEYRITTSAIS